MNLTLFDCVKLLEIALNKGFTTTHSYLLFAKDIRFLHEAYSIIQSMNRYSQIQLDFMSTILAAKPLHDLLLDEGGLSSEFTEKDTKRYTEVMVGSESDDPILNCACIQYSERGCRTNGGVFADRVSLDHQQIMSSLSKGDHLIRYMSKPYFEKYNQATWIPVLIRQGKIIDPVTGGM